MNAHGYNTLFIKTDVTKEADIKQLIHETVSTYGKLDIMYANAGVADDAPANELSYEKWRTIDINLSGVFLSDKYSIEQFLKQGTGGVIVNAGSIHSFVSLPTPTAYSPQKVVKLLTQNLCTAYAKYGIRINAVCPGYIEHPLLGSVNPQQKEYLASLHPQGRLEHQKKSLKLSYF